MGLHGPLPRLKLNEAEALVNLDPPSWLGPAARSFWLRHASWLASNRLLTTATADSFALCCDLWAKVRANDDGTVSRTWLDALKSFNSLSKLFRLQPCDKPGATPVTRHEDKDAFDF